MTPIQLEFAKIITQNPKGQVQNFDVHSSWTNDGFFTFEKLHFDEHRFSAITVYRGGSYQGQVKCETPEGLGRWTCKYGDLYEGQWLKGKYNGYGRKIYSEGEIYQGFWKDDLPHGLGTYTNIHGRTISGTWDHGKYIN